MTPSPLEGWLRAPRALAESQPALPSSSIRHRSDGIIDRKRGACGRLPGALRRLMSAHMSTKVTMASAELSMSPACTDPAHRDTSADHQAPLRQASGGRATLSSKARKGVLRSETAMQSGRVRRRMTGCNQNFPLCSLAFHGVPLRTHRRLTSSAERVKKRSKEAEE